MNHPASAPSTSEAQAVAEAERSGRPFLVYRDGEDRQQLLMLPSGRAAVAVGREASAGLALVWDSQVSRRHASLECTEDRWSVVDDGQSRNGTFVNGDRVSGRSALSDGDVLRFGLTSVVFRAPHAPREPVAAAAERVAPAGQSAPAEPPVPPPIPLSSTQHRVLTALCRPRLQHPQASPATDVQIAEHLVMSASEVGAHLQVLCAKLGVPGAPSADARTRLADQAISTGLVTDR